MTLIVQIEHDPETGLLIGAIPNVPGAHTQGERVEEVLRNLADVVELLRAEGVLLD